MNTEVSPPGLETDPDLFKVLTEIDIIAHMAKNEFERLLPETLTQAQFGILNRIMRLDIQETVTELAAAFQVTQPTMTSTLKKLSSKGYIVFLKDQTDGRVKRVAITKTGRSVREQVIRSIEPLMAAQNQAIGGLNYTVLLKSLANIRVMFENRLYDNQE